MTEGRTGDPPNAQGYVLLHVFVGPVMAVLSIFVFTLLRMPPQFSGPIQFNPMALGEVSFVLLGIFMLSWAFGLVPAILHAASMLILHRLMGTTTVWLLLTPFVGWLATWLPLLLIGGSDPRIFTDGAYMSLVGSAAAVGCLAIAWMRRIYPVRRRR